MLTNKHHSKTCSKCGFAKLCIDLHLSNADQMRLDALIPNPIFVKKGQSVYRTNSPFNKIYAVKAGSFKYINNHGQILAFYHPGDSFGFEGIYPGKHQVSVIALEDSSVCSVNYNGLIQLSRDIKELQDYILKLMSKQLNEQLNHINHHKNTKQRICAFLLKISDHHHNRGYSQTEFYLPMSRQDIANHLDLAIETVSRTLHTLTDEELFEINNKHIKIINLREVKIIANQQTS